MTPGHRRRRCPGVLRSSPPVSAAGCRALEQAMAHIEADLRWLEIIEARLDEVRRQPLPEPAIRPRGRPAKRR